MIQQPAKKHKGDTPESVPVGNVIHVMLIECPDEPGLISKVGRSLFLHNFNILSNKEYVERESKTFFMRTEFSGLDTVDEIHKDVLMILPKGSKVSIQQPKVKKRVVVMCTKEPYCLGDVLVSCNYSGDINAEIIAVVSNNIKLESLVAKFDHPFHYIDAKGLSREEHEQKCLDVIVTYEPDFIVLAKYMRILTPLFIAPYKNRIINIHHSFLPAFIGANPYKQAYERGVKIIGATAHFVTAELDNGPIIAQNVHNVDHTMSWREMATAGRDCEKVTLSKALRLVFDNKVLVHKNKTVILN